MASEKLREFCRWASMTVLSSVLTSNMSINGQDLPAQSAVGAFHQSGKWSTHAHDAQHSGVSPVASQKLAKIHWQVPVDLAPPEGEILIHYGSPVITAKNTVIVPVKTDTSSFRVEAHDGATGKKLWTLNTDYRPPFAGFMAGLGTTLSHHHLFVPDVAGGILVRANPDHSRGNISHLYFYGLENYLASPDVYQQAYVATGTFDFGFGYLVALDSRTLRVINRVRLTDPASGLDATMTDETTASPTVGHDGDVYYGVLENRFPLHNNRGRLLHFNRDLSNRRSPEALAGTIPPRL